MRRRYYVAPCDNAGTLGVPGVDPDAPPRDVTWLVCDRTKPMAHGGHESESEHYTRAGARTEADAMNAVDGAPVTQTPQEIWEGLNNQARSTITSDLRDDGTFWPAHSATLALWVPDSLYQARRHRTVLSPLGRLVAKYGRAQ